MARADEKTRIGFWIENGLLERCGVCWKPHGFPSRNEFVDRAIEHYITTQTLEQADDLLIARLSAAVAEARTLMRISMDMTMMAMGARSELLKYCSA